ncbi:MAG: TolC family protein [Oscillibacter sp.]|nr:TolC family protein [Oscillibacter sp.]
MLRFLLTQLSRSVGVFGRTIRAYVSRKTVGVTTKLRRLGNFSQSVSKTATSSVQSVVSAAQRPTKREDYVEVGRLLISKALIIRVLLALVLFGMFVYFVAWPFILGRFLTARFFVEDTRIETWSGRVIVYADKKKTVPMYAGRLTRGVLGGTGREYDAKGLLSYEGEFQDGVRSGRGIAYERGMMVYQGEFGEGAYQGSGTLYGKGGTRIYEGQFDKGLYNGSGKLYSDDFLSYEGQFAAGVPEGEGRRYVEKVLFYAGSFHEGLPHGQGVSYYPDGTAFYRGGFAAGIFEGSGTEYSENGSIRYTGSFSEGKYNGNGSLYIADGEHLDAEFQDGVPTGVVRWVRDGHLYYEGEWDADAPSGFGSLYNKAGKQIYQGQFSGGTLDGDWLVSLSPDDLRAAMAQAEPKSVPGGSTGFLIENAALGLRVLCSYRTESQESRVLAAYLSRPDDGWARLLPDASRVTLGNAQAQTEAEAESVVWREESVSLSPPPGASLSAGRYDARITLLAGSRAMILYRNNAASAIIWERVGDDASGSGTGTASGNGAGNGTGDAGTASGNTTGDAGTASGNGAGDAGTASGNGAGEASGGGAAQTEMDMFLASIDEMDTGAGVTGVSVRPEYGSGSPGDAVAACATAAEAVELTDALFAWWEQAERQAAFEENLARTDALLSEAETALSMGTGDENSVAALRDKKAALSDAVELCKAEKKKAELRTPAGVDMSSLDVPSMSVFFNPGEADVSRVALTAAAYAQTTGKDEAEAEAQTKTALVDLQAAYNGAQAALQQYEEAAKNAQAAAQDYSIGTGSKAAWSDALSAQSDAKSAVTSALSTFSRQANALNALTGGWVSRTYDWNADAFEPLFEAEVLPPVLDVPAGIDTGTNGGASGGGTSTGSGGASGGGTSTDSGGASGGGASTDSGGASGGGASTDSGGAEKDPDADSSLYGGADLRYTPDNGITLEPHTRIGEDGKIYPVDPEDEEWQLQDGQEEQEAEPDPEETLKQAGEVLVEALKALFGFSGEEEG